MKFWKKDRHNKSFPHIPQVFPQGTKFGGLYISVDIKSFDKIELFSAFFVIDKMNKGDFWQKKIPLDKAFYVLAVEIFITSSKNFKKGIDFPEKKGYNG